MNIKVFSKHPALWASVFLVVLTLAAYWQVIYNDFVNYDDPEYITENSYPLSNDNIDIHESATAGLWGHHYCIVFPRSVNRCLDGFIV